MVRVLVAQSFCSDRRFYRRHGRFGRTCIARYNIGYAVIRWPNLSERPPAIVCGRPDLANKRGLLYRVEHQEKGRVVLRPFLQQLKRQKP